MWKNDRGLPPQEKLSKAKAYTCEFVGITLLVYVSGLAVATTGGSRAWAAIPSNLAANAFANGIALFVLTFLFVTQSGAHFHPSVTMAVLIKNYFTRSKTGWFMIWYIPIHFAGGLLGGLLVWGTTWTKGAPAFNGVPRRGAPGISSGQVFVAETIITTVLILVILWSRLFVPDFKALIDRRRTPAWARATFMILFNGVRALGIGFMLIALTFGAVPISGAGMNSAKWLGLAAYGPKFPKEYVLERW